MIGKSNQPRYHRSVRRLPLDRATFLITAAKIRQTILKHRKKNYSFH